MVATVNDIQCMVLSVMARNARFLISCSPMRFLSPILGVDRAINRSYSTSS